MKPIRNPDSAAGDWYVDTACIDCEASRHVAPNLIIERNGKSVFAKQRVRIRTTSQTPAIRQAVWRARMDPCRRSLGGAVCNRSPGRHVRARHRTGRRCDSSAGTYARQRCLSARRLGAVHGRLAGLEHARTWTELTASLDKLTAYRFEWLLPGHGWPVHLSAAEMNGRLRALVERMRLR
jgi:hypothetical protein